MLFGQRNVAWIENEAHRLLGMLESSAGTTLPPVGAFIDDVYGHYPKLGLGTAGAGVSAYRLNLCITF